MNLGDVREQLKQFENDLIEAQNWYEAKGIELLTNELYNYLTDRAVFGISFYYYVPFDGWLKYSSQQDCQLSAGEIIVSLIEHHIKHGGEWSVYIETASGLPEYFIEYNGYEFMFDDMGDYEAWDE